MCQSLRLLLRSVIAAALVAGPDEREAEKQAKLLCAQLVLFVGLFGDLFGRRVRRWMAQCRSS